MSKLIKSGVTHKTINKDILNKTELLIVKYYGRDKLRFYFPKAGLINGLQGLRNIRFSIKLHLHWYNHVFIRLPFFYFEKNNFDYKIGLPNLHLWKIYR